MIVKSEKDDTKDRTTHMQRLLRGTARPHLKSLVAAALFMVAPLSQIAAEQSDMELIFLPDTRNMRF